MARDTKDIQFRELKDTISQLNTTIAAQTQLITSLQKSLDAANEREAEQTKQLAAFKEQIDYLAPVVLMPGEDEMGSLAYNALGALKGELPLQVYRPE